MQINDPVFVAELTERHNLYERALVENDVPVLDSLFWDSPHAIRYGVTENLHGAEEIRAFRSARPKINLERQVVGLNILTLGASAGIVNLEFRRMMDGTERHGRQTQFWIRFSGGWKIVSAHVSLLPGVPNYVDAALKRIRLDVDGASRAALQDDFAQISRIAEFLMEFPLDQEVESAPVFQA